MSKKIVAIIAVVCQLLLLGNGTVFGAQDSIFSKKLDDAYYSVLDNRLLVKMPEGTEDIPMQNGIMSPQVSSHDQTRLMTELINNQCIVLLAEELYQYSSGNLEKDTRSIWEKISGQTQYDYSLSPVYSNNGADFMIITITNNDPSFPMIQGAVVKSPDNALMFLGIYANEGAYEQKEDCLNLSYRILSSIMAGNRTLDLSEHEETVYNMSIDVKKGYILTKHRGVDFEVNFIEKMIPVGGENSTMGIYIGGYPSYTKEMKGYTDSDIRTIDGTILGEDVEWLYYDKENEYLDDKIHMQTLIEIPYNGYLHIFMNAADKTSLEEMEEMAESLDYIE